MSKIGFQTQFDSAEALLYNREVLPRAWMAINVVKPEWLEQMVAVNPDARRIFRHHPNRPWADDPERYAVEAVSHIGGMMAGVGQFFTHVTDNNEYILGPDHVSPELIARADRYIGTFIPTARAELGMGTCWGNFNVGHWGGGPTEGVEIIEHFPLALAAAQQDKDSPISFHDYNWRTLRDESLSYVGRWARAMPDIRERYLDVNCMVTELGIDRVAREWGADHEGYRMAFDDPGQAVEMFCGDQGLGWVNDLANQYDWMLALLIFGCGMVEPWRPQGFDIMNHENDVAVLDRIKLFPVTPPEPPNGGDEVRIPDSVEIYDFEHGPHAGDPTVSKEWLESIFGPCITVHPITEIYQPQPGEIVYELAWINCKAGSVSVIIELDDVDGNPVIGESVVFGWPSADPHGLVDNDWAWTDNGAVGITEPPDGHVGPAMSQDSYYSPDKGECGAHFLWIWNHPSQMVDGVGMLPFHDLVPGANHLHTEYGFRAVVWGEEPPELPDETTLKLIQVDVAKILKIMEKGYTPPEEPPVETGFLGQYFNNVDLSGEPALVRDDEEINFFWGEGSPGPGIGADNFSVHWTGEFTFEARDYGFHALVDDGFRLWVDEHLVMEAWKDQAPTRYDATVTMTAGQHHIRVQYYERAGGGTCKVWWD